MHLCENIQGGRAPELTSKKQIDDLVMWNKNLPSPATSIWGPYSDTLEEGVWKDFYSAHILTDKDQFLKGEPNGRREENCLNLDLLEGKWNDAGCNNERGFFQCACSFKDLPILKLRGL